MTRDEIVAAIRAGDTRLTALRPLAAAHPETPLPTGEWRVRDALSHRAGIPQMPDGVTPEQVVAEVVKQVAVP